jgi:hypothetical protein
MLADQPIPKDGEFIHNLLAHKLIIQTDLECDDSDDDTGCKENGGLDKPYDTPY